MPEEMRKFKLFLSPSPGLTGKKANRTDRAELWIYTTNCLTRFFTECNSHAHGCFKV